MIKSLSLNLRTSPRLNIFCIALLLGSFFCLEIITITQWLKFFLILIQYGYLVYFINQRLNFFHFRRLVHLHWSTKQQWQIKYNTGEVDFIKVKKHYISLPWIIIIYYKKMVNHQKGTIILLNDSASEFELRHLRILLNIQKNSLLS